MYPPHSGDDRTPRLHLALLLLLTLANIALRWPGIEYSLPQVANNDEIVYYHQHAAFVDQAEHPETYRRFVAYPSLFVRGAVLLPRGAVPESGPDLDGERARAVRDYAFLRRCVAVFGSLVVPATWLLARYFVGSGWALVAGALAGTSLLSYCLTTQARPHGVALPLITLALAAAVHAARRGTLRSSLSAGLAAGGALAALQSGAAVLFALVAAHALRWRADRRRALGGLLAAGLVCGAIFLAAYPAALAKILSKPFAGSTRHGFLASHGVRLEDFEGGGVPIVWRALLDFEPFLLVAAGLTILAACVRRIRREPLTVGRGELFVVLAFALPYLAALCAFERTFYRFVLPLVPCLALCAVIGLRSAGRRAGPVLAAILCAAQLACAVQVMRLHVAGDTTDHAARWMRANLDRESARIAISPWVDLPLVRTSAALAAHGLATEDEVAPWLDHQRKLPPETLDALGWSIVDLPLRRARQREALRADPAAFVRSLDADYLVIDAFTGGERPILELVRTGAREAGRLLARFTPQGPDEEQAAQIDPYVGSELFRRDHFVLQILQASAIGIPLEIYALER